MEPILQAKEAERRRDCWDRLAAVLLGAPARVGCAELFSPIERTAARVGLRYGLSDFEMATVADDTRDRLERWSPIKPGAQHGDELAGWVFRVADHAAIAIVRARKATVNLDPSDDEDPASEVATAENTLQLRVPDEALEMVTIAHFIAWLGRTPHREAEHGFVIDAMGLSHTMKQAPYVGPGTNQKALKERVRHLWRAYEEGRTPLVRRRVPNTRK